MPLNDTIIKLLILEDQVDDAELILLELEKNTIEIEHRHVSDKDSYQNALIHFQPDLILSDYNIPGYNGLEALADARAMYPHIPFIIVTGTADTDESVRYIVEHGVSDFILKDKLQRLNLTIRRELEQLHLHGELKVTQSDLLERTKELELLSLVASKTNIGVIITDAKGLTKWVNKGFETLTGYTRKEIVGEKPGDLLQGKDTDPDAVAEIRRMLKKKTSFSIVILNYHKDGHPYWVKLSIDPVFDQQDKLSTFIAIQEDVTENKEMELQLIKSNENLKQALNEKQILMQEIHHRVKNNLAIINALLTLELFELPDDSKNRLILERTINRILSIKEAHELLYDNSSFTHINLKTYLNNLLSEIQHTFSSDKDQNITVDLDLPDIQLDINTLIPLGMLLNELFTNSYKYAFNNRSTGSITLHIREDDASGLFTFDYKDDGPGLNKAVDLDNPPSLGFQIIQTLLSQLKARYTYDFHHKFYLSFSFQVRTKGSHSTDMSLHTSKSSASKNHLKRHK